MPARPLILALLPIPTRPADFHLATHRRLPRRHLHLSRHARERLGLDDFPFALSGRLVLADLHAARRLAERLHRRPGAEPETAATPGRLYAAGLVHELLHGLIDRYRRQAGRDLWRRALDRLAGRLGSERLDAALAAFAEAFPPPPVWRGEVTAAEFVAGETAATSHRELLLEEMLLL